MTRQNDGDGEANAPVNPPGEQPPERAQPPRTTFDSLALRTSGTTRIEPGSSKLIHALRFIGYTFEQAVADVIDNSVSAEARNVVLRFLTEGDRLQSFVIADDGNGMSEARLEEAMRFGSQDDYDDRALGKYGLGLKLASLSQAATLEVLTRHNKHSFGRRWTVEGLSSDWRCEILDPSAVGHVMDKLLPDMKGRADGTLVVWRDIDRLSLGRQGLLKGLEQLSRRLHMHLGLHFHRFLETRGVRMWTEIHALDDEEASRRQSITAINPFKYPTSGHPDYPRTVHAEIPDVGSLTVKACIWPPNSKDIAYKLGGKAAQRQGFYFYRRDRLIQAGGWNGVIEHESEPHSSLARLAIDLPPQLDSQFGLSVQKSRVVTPPAFAAALIDGKDADGESWLARYRKAANQAYRHDERAVEEYPLVPVGGLPADLVQLVREELAGGRQRKVRPVRIEWTALASPDFFEIDRDELVIRLNKNYRTAVLGGRRGTPSDAPILKLLLFLLVQEDFDRDRMSGGRKEHLDAINRLLSEAVEHEDRR
jgi:Histidine kinase-, DNA gyrase B-, and HSP90-like ATPase